MFVALTVANVTTLIAIIFAAQHINVGKVKHSLINPLQALIVLDAIIILDFVFAEARMNDVGTIEFGSMRLSDHDAFVEAYFIYTVNHAAMLIGIALAAVFYKAPKIQKLGSWQKYVLRRQRQSSAFLLFAVSMGASITALIIGMQGIQGGNIFSLVAQRTDLFRDDIVVGAATYIFAPGALIFATTMIDKRWVGLASIVLVLALAPITVGRAQIFVLLYCLGCLLQANFVHISSKLLLPSVGAALVALIFLQYVQRGQEAHDSFGQMLTDEGGLVSSLFDTEQIAIAEGITAVVAREDLRRGYYETFLGIATLPIPRSIFEAKPIPPSTYFTSVVDPDRWYWTGSAMTVSGVGNLYLEFGWASPVVMAVLAALWATIAMRSAQNFPSNYSVLGLCYCFWTMLLFLRGDLYVVALGLWPLAAAFVALWGIGIVLRPLGALAGSGAGRPPGFPAPAGPAAAGAVARAE